MKEPVLTPIEQGIVEVFVRMATALSVPKSVGEIYGILFASARPLAFQDIIDRLRISKGSASQGLRWLRSNSAIRLVYVPGERRDHFEPETEMRSLLSGFLREKVQPHLAGSGRISALRAALREQAEEGKDGDAKVIRGRIDKLESWQKKARAVVPLITKVFG